MPGMNGGLSPTNPALQAAFKTALLSQGVLALLIFVVLAIAWVACRELLPLRARIRLSAARAAVQPEPAARRLLRIGFGALWVFDAILQAQAAMPAGLPAQVIAPAAAGSPGWVLHLVNWAGTGWSFHPVQAAASAVWVQLGVGAWLIACPRGRWSRLAGLASVGWGLVVWVFGEAFGGMLAPGQSVLFGAPGAALIYCAAGALVALPASSWRGDRLGRRVLRATGGGLALLTVLQAWPGRGFWQGTLHGRPGSLTAMIQSMAATQQPRALARLVSDFGVFAAAHGFAVNLVAVLVLVAGAAALLTGRRAIVRPAVFGLIAFFLVDWVLVEDLGFFGGIGTDPNSMLPLALLVLAGYVAMTRPAPQPASQPAAQPAAGAAEPAAGPARTPARLGRRLTIALGTASASVVVALWAGAMLALGAAPMAVAETSRTADPIIATSLNGSAATLDSRAAPFTLTDQDGRPVSLASLRGKVVLMTFLDPVCTNDCPLIAQEFRAAGQLLGSRVSHVALVAIVANPLYRSLAYTRAFDRQEALTGVPGWLFLTGTLPQLTQVWRDYYVTAEAQPAGSMVLHPDVAYVIDARGIMRLELNMDPGPGTASSQSSFAAELAQDAGRFLGST
jgi:cytochrome oxidase Cu insertion factor (SCO1/SenC/PrrC family)